MDRAFLGSGIISHKISRPLSESDTDILLLGLCKELLGIHITWAFSTIILFTYYHCISLINDKILILAQGFGVEYESQQCKCYDFVPQIRFTT